MTIDTAASDMQLPRVENASIASSSVTDEARRAYARRLVEHRVVRSPQFRLRLDAFKARLISGEGPGDLMTGDEFIAAVEQRS